MLGEFENAFIQKSDPSGIGFIADTYQALICIVTWECHLLTLNLFALSEMNNVDLMANVNELSLAALFCPLLVGSKSAIFRTE